MWISILNRAATVTRATPEERAFLREYLSFPDPNAHWMGKSKEEAVHRLYEEASASFPSGFVTSVVRAGADAGIKVEVIDNRVVPVERDEAADLAWLRPYQRAAFERCAERVRGVCWHVTGAGKSELLVALTRAFPCSWLLLAPNLSLVNNAADRFLKRNREHGIDLGEPGRIGEGKWVEGDRLTCATYQSIHRALGSQRCQDLLARVGGLVCDESHMVPSLTFLAATRACNAYWRIGLSGTPLARGDMKSALAIAALGPIIHRVRPEELVATGDLSRARVRFTRVNHPDPDGYTYDEVYRELVVESPQRNAVLTALAKKAEKPALLFVKNITHGRVLTQQLRSQGIRTEFVWGTHSAKQIEQHLKALVRGDVEVITTSSVLKQGVDLPSLRSVLLASAGKSIIDVLQKLGRGSRVERDAAGKVVKDEFTLYDIYDAGQEWLEAHAKGRRRAYLSEGYEVTVEGEAPAARAATAARGRAVTWQKA